MLKTYTNNRPFGERKEPRENDAGKTQGSTALFNKTKKKEENFIL